MNSSVATIPQALSVATSTRWRSFRSTSTARQSVLVPAIFASTKCTCFGIGSYRLELSHLFRDRKLSPGTIQSRCAALRFLFVKTLRRPYLLDEIPLPKRPRKLPAVLNPEEVARLIDSARNLMHRTMLMTLYATGLRRAELCHLKVTDIDSKRMVIHVHQGKGIHQHLDTTLTLMIAGHRVGHYSAEGKLLTLLTKKQINAVKKRLRGKVTEQTFPLNVQIPQTTRDSHVTTASTATNL
ncbi:MAG: tyrosine-type recombinase/integrase [Terracidiphilus sp.]